MDRSIRRSTDLVLATAGSSKDNSTIHGMQAQLSQYQLRSNVPMIALHGVISRPLPGAQLAVISPGGDPSQAVCIGVNDPRYYLQGLPDGCVGVAHHLGASILFYADHIQIEGNGAPIVIANAGQVTVTTSSKVRVVGDLEVTGEITARADSAPVHLSTHLHAGVKAGGDKSAGPVAGT